MDENFNQDTRAGTRSISLGAMAGIAALSSLVGIAGTLIANKKSQEANEELWEKNNQYNTPENQARLLREGGFNPAMSMANGAISSGTSNNPAASVSPPNFDSFGSSVADSLRLANETKLANSQFSINEQEAESGRIRNMFAMQEHAANLMEVASRIGLNTMQGRKLAREADFIYKQAQRYDEISDASIRYQNSQSRLSSAEADLKEVESRFAPEHWTKILRNLDKQGSVFDSQVRANDSEAAYKSAMKALTDAQVEGVDMDNQLKEDVANAVVDKAFSEAESSYWETQNRAKLYYSGQVGTKFPAKQEHGEYVLTPERPGYARHLSTVRRKHK